MTIYSQHVNRGKVQILATYNGPASVTSATVTSVDNVALAAPIVTALNRISASATVPVSVWDERHGPVDHYPTKHLIALTERSARQALLEGAHSLWYELAMTLLHRALSDLDLALAAVPAPVRTAITGELEMEAHRLRDELADYSEGIAPSDTENRRIWRFEHPFVEIDESVSELNEQCRSWLDDMERGVSPVRLARAVADLRLLLDAYQRCGNPGARLMIDGFEISDDPYDDEGDRYFLNIQAPIPNDEWKRTNWNVEICRWVPDGPQTEESGGAIGEPVLDCARPEPPDPSEIVDLLNRCGGRSDVLEIWGKTAVGAALAGTAFVVTKRYED